MMPSPIPTRRSRPCRQPQAGAAVLEMALVAPVFLLSLLAVFEFGLMFFVNLTMQHAVREGARYAITGQSDLDLNTSEPSRQRAVIEKIKASSMGMFDSVQPVISVNGTRYDNSNAYPASMFAGSGETLVLQLDCRWPVVTPLMRPFFAGGEYRFAVAATMRNEAF